MCEWFRIKQFHIVQYLGCYLEANLSKESMKKKSLKKINTKKPKKKKFLY